MDRTAGIKATSSVATQTHSKTTEISEMVHIDSFQDHIQAAADDLENSVKLVHIDSFQDPSYMAAADDLERNLGNWCTLTHFKTLHIW